MKSKQLRLDIFVFLLVGFSLNFFSPKALAASSMGAIRYLYIFAAIFISLPYTFRKTSGLGTPIKWIFICQLISIFMAFYSWDQGSLTSLRAPVLFMLWPFFFYLLKTDYPFEKIEKIIMIYGAIYLLLFAYQFTHSDTVIFGDADDFREERGVTRILFPGGGVLFLSAFIALNRFTQARKKEKLFYLFFVLAALASTVLQVSRQDITAMLIIYTFHFVRGFSAVKKFVSVAAIGCLVVFVLNSDNPITKGLQETQQQTNAEGSNYIRLREAQYFLFEFSPNVYSRIFGNGVAYRSATEESNYGKVIFNLTQTEGFFFSDLGLIGFYAYFGIFAVIAYIVLFIRSMKVKIPHQYQYLKYYVFYLIFTCLTSQGVYGTSFLATNVFVFYMLQAIYVGRHPMEEEEEYFSYQPTLQ